MVRFLGRRLGIWGLAAAVGFMAVCLSGTAQATLLWYDGFEIAGASDGAGPTYVAGALASQQGGDDAAAPGGIGFFDDALGNPNTWLGVNNTNDLDQNNDLVPGSLTVNGQINPSTGDKVGDNTAEFGAGFRSRTSRDMNAPLQTLDGTYYMSFLVNFGQGNGADPNYRAIEFWNGKNPIDAGDGVENDGRVGDNVLTMSLGVSSFGNYNDAVNQGLDPNPNTQLSFKVRGVREELGLSEETNHQFEEHLEYDDQNGATGFHDSKTHCIVMRFDLTTNDAEIGGPGDRVRIYLNPPGLLNGINAPPGEPDVPSIDVSSVDLLVDSMSAMIQFIFNGGGVNYNAASMDELYVGTEWDDVVCCNFPIPEPATLTLVGFGALGLFAAARRRVA